MAADTTAVERRDAWFAGWRDAVDGGYSTTFYGDCAELRENYQKGADAGLDDRIAALNKATAVAEGHRDAREVAIGALAIAYSSTKATSTQDQRMIDRNSRLLRIIIDAAPMPLLEAALAQHDAERGAVTVPALLTAEELVAVAQRGRCCCGHLHVFHAEHVTRYDPPYDLWCGVADCPCMEFRPEPAP